MTKKSVVRTNHTILVKVTSHNSGGRASIEYGHVALTDPTKYSDVSIRNPIFKNFDIGTFLVVKIKLSGSRRIVGSVSEDPFIESAKNFEAEYKKQLDFEQSEYERKHGIVSVSYPSVKAEDPITETPKVEETKAETPRKKKLSQSDVYISDDDNKVFEAIRKISEYRHVAIMMIGASGYGKTTIPEQKAKDWGLDFLRWDCATVRDPEEFFGFRGAVEASTMTDEGEVLFSQSEFTKKVEQGNCVILLDELNRIDPYISNILFPLLDHAGKTIVAGHEIKVGENVIFVATINQGFQFTGTFQLDSALQNRFTAKIMVEALPRTVELQLLETRIGIDSESAEQIVFLMHKLRRLNQDGKLNLDASTRVSLQVAELVKVGMSIQDAINYTVLSGSEEEERKEIVDAMRLVLKG